MKSKVMLFLFALGLGVSAFASTASVAACKAECAADREDCKADGFFLPRQCVQMYKGCVNRCR